MPSALSDDNKNKNKMADRDMRRDVARSPLMYGIKIEDDNDEEGKNYYLLLYIHWKLINKLIVFYPRSKNRFFSLVKFLHPGILFTNSKTFQFGKFIQNISRNFDVAKVSLAKASLIKKCEWQMMI